jgi:hypothetical protein
MIDVKHDESQWSSHAPSPAMLCGQRVVKKSTVADLGESIGSGQQQQSVIRRLELIQRLIQFASAGFDTLFKLTIGFLAGICRGSFGQPE